LSSKATQTSPVKRTQKTDFSIELAWDVKVTSEKQLINRGIKFKVAQLDHKSTTHGDQTDRQTDIHTDDIMGWHNPSIVDNLLYMLCMARVKLTCTASSIRYLWSKVSNQGAHFVCVPSVRCNIWAHLSDIWPLGLFLDFIK